MPSASQCHTSTCAPWSAVHAEDVTRATLNVSTSAIPGLTAPVEGSTRMSERSSFSSTKYGPSVSAGRTMHEGTVTAADAAAPPEVAAAVGADVPAPVAGCAVGDDEFSAAGAHAATRPAAPTSASV